MKALEKCPLLILLITAVVDRSLGIDYLYKDCEVLGSYFCLGARDNVPAYVGQGCMLQRNCQMVLRANRIPDSQKIFWKICGVVNKQSNRRHWFKWAVTNDPINIVNSGHRPEDINFPKETLYVQAKPFDKTSVWIQHQESNVPKSDEFEALTELQRRSNYKILPSSVDSEDETGASVDCHNFETGYSSTYADKHSNNAVTFTVKYLEQIQISILDFYYRVDEYANLLPKETYDQLNLVLELPLHKIWEDKVGDPSKVTTEATTVPKLSSPITDQPTGMNGRPIGGEQDAKLSKRKKRRDWVIGVAVAAVILVATIAICTVCIYCIKKKRSKAKEDTKKAKIIDKIDKENNRDLTKKGDGNDFATISKTSEPPAKGKGSKGQTPSPYSVVTTAPKSPYSVVTNVQPKSPYSVID